MWKLEKPSYCPRETFLLCISKVKDKDFKQRLESIKELVHQASDEFERATPKTLLHTLPRNDIIGNTVTSQEMSSVYTARMAKKSSPGRPIYDKLLSAPVNGRCPLCGQRVVSSLDHHLPKATYPALAVAPINLVPACAECNKAKAEKFPQSAEEEIFHPYFDDLNCARWLYAKVIEQRPIALKFYVDPPDDWNEIKVARIRHQFTILDLSSLYSSEAANELGNIRHYLSKLHMQAGIEGLREHLVDQFDSCSKFSLNSWKTATYSALSINEWFYSEGFR